MRALAGLGIVLGALFLAYAVWLLATPDYDGGRRPVGALVLGPALLLLAASLWSLARARRRS